MAKDDYDKIVYQVLLYLYAALKREVLFDLDEFKNSAKSNVSSDEYFSEILIMMQDEGLISDVLIAKAWGGKIVPESEYKDMRITARGIHYLKDNGTMNRVKNTFLESKGLIADMIIRLAV